MLNYFSEMSGNFSVPSRYKHEGLRISICDALKIKPIMN